MRVMLRIVCYSSTHANHVEVYRLQGIYKGSILGAREAVDKQKIHNEALKFVKHLVKNTNLSVNNQ